MQLFITKDQAKKAALNNLRAAVCIEARRIYNRALKRANGKRYLVKVTWAECMSKAWKVCKMRMKLKKDREITVINTTNYNQTGTEPNTSWSNTPNQSYWS